MELLSMDDQLSITPASHAMVDGDGYGYAHGRVSGGMSLGMGMSMGMGMAPVLSKQRSNPRIQRKRSNPLAGSMSSSSSASAPKSSVNTSSSLYAQRLKSSIMSESDRSRNANKRRKHIHEHESRQQDNEDSDHNDDSGNEMPMNEYDQTGHHHGHSSHMYVSVNSASSSSSGSNALHTPTNLSSPPNLSQGMASLLNNSGSPTPSPPHHSNSGNQFSLMHSGMSSKNSTQNQTDYASVEALLQLTHHNNPHSSMLTTHPVSVNVNGMAGGYAVSGGMLHPTASYVQMHTPQLQQGSSNSSAMPTSGVATSSSAGNMLLPPFYASLAQYSSGPFISDSDLQDAQSIGYALPVLPTKAQLTSAPKNMMAGEMYGNMAGIPLPMQMGVGPPPMAMTMLSSPTFVAAGSHDILINPMGQQSGVPALPTPVLSSNSLSIHPPDLSGPVSILQSGGPPLNGSPGASLAQPGMEHASPSITIVSGPPSAAPALIPAPVISASGSRTRPARATALPSNAQYAAAASSSSSSRSARANSSSAYSHSPASSRKSHPKDRQRKRRCRQAAFYDDCQGWAPSKGICNVCLEKSSKFSYSGEFFFSAGKGHASSEDDGWITRFFYNRSEDEESGLSPDDLSKLSPKDKMYAVLICRKNAPQTVRTKLREKSLGEYEGHIELERMYSAQSKRFILNAKIIRYRTMTANHDSD